MFAGLIVQIELPAILSRAAFGAFSLVSNITSLVGNVLRGGTILAVSRFSAQEPEKARAVQHYGLAKMQQINNLRADQRSALAGPVTQFAAGGPVGRSWAGSQQQVVIQAPTGPLQISGTLSLDESGRMFLTGFAERTFQQHAQYGGTVSRSRGA